MEEEHFFSDNFRDVITTFKRIFFDESLDVYEDLWKTNREKKLAPKQGAFYCGACDMNMVGAGQKCDVCGNKEPPKKFKK